MGKRRLDAFGSTNLDFILRAKGSKTVALASVLANCCVESTMRTAYEFISALGPSPALADPSRGH